MFDWLIDLISGQWWAYALIGGMIIFDAVIPVLPSETALITAGILAARDALDLWLVILVGGIAAVIGDNITYTIGSRGPGDKVRDLMFRGDRPKRLVRWAERQMDVRPWIVGIARFVPGGRTAASFTAGEAGMSRARFLLWIIPGGFAWSAFNVLLGYLGGQLFRQNFWLPLLISLAIAGLLSLVAELLRRRTTGEEGEVPAGDERDEQGERATA